MNIGLWQEKYKVSLEIKKSLRDWKEICPKTPGIRLKKLSLGNNPFNREKNWWVYFDD